MPDIYKENMGRDAKEAERYQFFFFLTSVDSKRTPRFSHPSAETVPLILPSSPTIADIGTGTGQFLVQLAIIHPGASFHGFDISPVLFPPVETLPSNVHLDTMDIKQPIESSQHSKYDVVHVRLMAAGIAPAEWELVVQNIIYLLKPGGAVQWEECNWADVQHIRGGIDSSVYTARLMGSRFKNALKDKFSYGWKILPQIFDSKGLIQIEEDILSSDRVVETRTALTRNGMQAIFSWSRLLSSRNAAGSLQMDELDLLESEAARDIESGCYVRFDVHVMLGFKV
ncbi:hypothetical protein BCON_0269g00010 [Botryotinia convoluta]|uniref:Methyltransferase domain-containing protein n=1 Tax=Botryotinia convoluta TaxID=54673 RepID=A0A4Z1HFS5_9HELO|nr:hypothetical protein BCON_0269g00010 [Botryotinia convoluta]